MKTYPIKEEQVLSKEDWEKGYRNIRISCKEYAQDINAAFYEGFLVSMIESKEEAINITPIQRAVAAAMACDKWNEYFGGGGSRQYLNGLLKRLEEMNNNE